MSQYIIPSENQFAHALAALGKRAQRLRLARNLTQADLAARCAIGVATVARFEATGITSSENVLRIAYVLGAEETFARLMETPKYNSLDEALAEPKKRARQRARRRS